MNTRPQRAKLSTFPQPSTKEKEPKRKRLLRLLAAHRRPCTEHTRHKGHKEERARGQYFAPFRYYNPATARWNMRDPLGFVDGPNVYAYVAGNPVNGHDPSGLGSCPSRVPDNKALKINGHEISPLHKNEPGTSPHRKIDPPGVKVGEDGYIVKNGKKSGQHLSDHPALKSLSKKLTALGVILGKVIASIPIVITVPPELLPQPPDRCPGRMEA